MDSDPPRIAIRGEYTKTGNPRMAFISREAKEAVNEWLKVRAKYLSANRGQYGKDREDPRLFPFESNTAHVIWKNALEKTGNHERDPRTRIALFHPHVLRKFFRIRLGSVIPVDIVEALMGHEAALARREL